jgi:hypothetical protein
MNATKIHDSERALTTAIALALAVPSEKRSIQCVHMARDFAARLSGTAVERCKRNAMQMARRWKKHWVKPPAARGA